MQTFKRFLKPILFLVGFGLVNMLLTFLFTPFCTPSSEMWKHYREQEDLDTVFVGTSACYESINPEVIDQITGWHSYNMGTNAESLRQSLEAIKTAYNDHQIERAVLVLDEVYLQTNKEQYYRPEASFTHAENKGQGLMYRLENALNYMTQDKYMAKPESINYFFPWVTNRIDASDKKKLKVFTKELQVKLGLTEIQQADWNNVRDDTGFKGFSKTINYNTIKSPSYVNWDSSMLSDKGLGYLDDLIEYCQDKEIELTIIVPPYPTSSILKYGNTYYERYKYINSYLEKYNTCYYDFNLARPDLYEKESDYFKDWDHNNATGAQVFSTSLGNFLMDLEAGEQVETEFYSWPEYVGSIDYIDAVTLKATSTPGEGIHLKAYPFTGISKQVEYAFYLYDEDTDAYICIQNYSSARELDYVPDTDGKYKFRVYARLTSSTEKYDRYHDVTCNYYTN